MSPLLRRELMGRHLYYVQQARVLADELAEATGRPFQSIVGGAP